MPKKDRSPAPGERPGAAKRLAALAAVILLVAVYAVALISSLIGFPGWERIFRLALGLTVAVPILAWILIWCIGRLTGRHTMASLDILNSDPEERARMEEAVQKQADKKG